MRNVNMTAMKNYLCQYCYNQIKINLTGKEWKPPLERFPRYGSQKTYWVLGSRQDCWVAAGFGNFRKL